MSLIMFVSCDETNVQTKQTGVKIFHLELKEFKHDDCEYIYVRSGYQFGMTHKGNCKNNIHNCN